jgi:UDP-N-acetylglucosamine/UDP-N-acetylgalactosamine diphosphorylase
MMDSAGHRLDEPSPALVAALRTADQLGVLAHWERLDTAARERLLAQVTAIEWGLVADLTRRVRRKQLAPPAEDTSFDLASAESPPCRSLRCADPTAAARGREALAAGAVGAILVAGGQGTRLGCTGPKGLCAVGPLSQATLFDVLLGRLAAIRRRYGRGVPLAIMTSAATDDETRRFLASRQWCGLDPDDVFLFRQQDLPAFDAADGNILLAAPDRVALAPDGHGGMLSALAGVGGLEWFGRRGVATVASFQVDNPLALPLDPEFLGAHLDAAAEFTLQVIRKREPAERVGVIATSGGVTRVVEYSDLPATAAAERLADGRLRFHAGSIAVHAFALEFLARCAARGDALPLHAARKAVPFVDADGHHHAPRAPNAVKFERFIFDILPLARRVCVVEVEPGEGFAPLKNPSGAAADTPEHVREALIARDRAILAAAGVTVDEGVVVELDAATILDADDVTLALPPGTRISESAIIRADPMAPRGTGGGEFR